MAWHTHLTLLVVVVTVVIVLIVSSLPSVTINDSHYLLAVLQMVLAMAVSMSMIICPQCMTMTPENYSIHSQDDKISREEEHVRQGK
jgi:hypothetical protein